MKKLITFFILFLSISSYSNVYAYSISYNIEYLDSSESFLPLYISINTKLDEKGEFLIRFPFGFSDAVTHKSITSIQKDEHTFLMKGAPNQEVYFKYKIHIENSYQLIQFPEIEKDFFRFTAFTVLATPEFYLDDEWDIHYSFDNLSDDFKLATSFSPDKKSFDLKATMAQFKKSVFIGGTQLKQDIIYVNDKPISILYKNTLKRFKQDPSDYFQQLIQTHRDYRNDHDFDHYLVYVEEPECIGTRSRIAAEHFFNAVVALLPCCSKNHTVIRETSWIFSHELSHAWFGYKMSLDYELAKDLIWFLEGFNDYYGLILALQSGLMTKEEYLEGLNDLIRSYYLMPTNRMSNEMLMNNHYADINNPFFGFVAMARGHLWAHWLSNELSKKGLDLDNFIQNLILEKNKPSEHFTKEMIYNRFHEYLGDELWSVFHDAIEFGEEFDFENQLKHIAPIKMQEIEVPDFGFDFKEAIEKSLVKDVRPNSPESLAGLKEHQEIKVPLYHFHPEREVVLGVLENDEYKEIIFFPLKKIEVIPQFVIHKEST